MQTCLASTTYANIKSAKSVSYFASLWEALNPSYSAYSILKHSSLGELKTKPAPHSLSFEDLSTYKSHVKARRVIARNFSTLKLKSRVTLPSSLRVSLTMKFATT